MKGDIHEIEFMARREHWNYGISLYARMVFEGVKQAIVQPWELKDVELDYVGQATPMITISDHQAQQLMDQLWDCGLRPSEGTGSAGQLAATQEHLRDMRTITFKMLNIKGE